MDWVDYRALCDRGDVLSRWLLQHSAELLEGSGHERLATRLRAILEQVGALPRPADHLGGPEADFFEVQLEPRTVREIAGIVASLAADPSRRLESGRGLGGMAAAWAEFVAWLDRAHSCSLLR